MPTLHESTRSQELVELQDWYLNGLRPKIARAAGSGAVELSAAAACDRRLREFLSLPEPDDEKAAA
jgi:hypothetical protein